MLQKCAIREDDNLSGLKFIPPPSFPKAFECNNSFFARTNLLSIQICVKSQYGLVYKFIFSLIRCERRQVAFSKS
jgi:hypothetical protein